MVYLKIKTLENASLTLLRQNENVVCKAEFPEGHKHKIDEHN
jgi:hypothetical protein